MHKELKECIAAETKQVQATAETTEFTPDQLSHLEVLSSYLVVLASLYVTGNAFLQECTKAFTTTPTTHAISTTHHVLLPPSEASRPSLSSLFVLGPSCLNSIVNVTRDSWDAVKSGHI